MTTPRELETGSFNALETICLRMIPKKRPEAMTYASDRCSLEQFVSRIRKQRYGVDRDEPIPESGDSLSIALEGRFAIKIETGEFLGEGDRFWSIEINHLDGRGRRRGKGREAEVKGVKEVEGVEEAEEDEEDEEGKKDAEDED
ncbi:hypothetical protein FS837_003909 [Tulasnella sp. UAMH 9824]|nr:hypothetical protein FS837_003909 [Tulasnella sp. UAMH 9824]